MPMGDGKRGWVRMLHATGCLMDLKSSEHSNADVSWTRFEFAAAELLGAGSRRMAGSSRHMNHPAARGGGEEYGNRQRIMVMSRSVTLYAVVIWLLEVSRRWSRQASGSGCTGPSVRYYLTVEDSTDRTLVASVSSPASLLQGHFVL